MSKNIKRLLQITQNIDEKSSQEIDYILHSGGGLDFINLYFSDPISYSQIKQNIINFLEKNKFLYNPKWDWLTDFMVNVVSTYWLFDNFLLQWSHLDTNLSFLKKNRDFFEKIISDNINSLDIKIKIEWIYNFFLKSSICDLFLEISADDLIRWLWDFKSNIFYLIFSQKYSVFFSNQIESIVFEQVLFDYVRWIIINALSSMDDSSFENFVIKNHNKIKKDEKIFVPDRDFNLAMQILLSPFDVNQKYKYFQDLNMWQKTFWEIVEDDFDINKVQNNQNEIVVSLYELWFFVKVSETLFDLDSLIFTKTDAKVKFVEKNINNIEKVDTNILLEILYSSNELFFDKIINSDLVIKNIYKSLDFDRINLQKLDIFVSKLYFDEKFKIDTYKKVYSSNGFVLLKTIESMKQDSIFEILDFNKNNEIEDDILYVMSKKTSPEEYINIYIKNILKESSFAELKFMFSYWDIIKDIWMGKADIETIKIIISCDWFLSSDIVKAWNFVSFLIQNQKNEIDKLFIVDYFFEMKKNYWDEFFDTVFSSLIVDYIHKKNILNNALKMIKDNMDIIIPPIESDSIFYKVKLMFFWQRDIDKLKNIKEQQKNANVLTEKSKQLLDQTIFEIDQILDFIKKYNQFFAKIELDSQISELKLSKERLILLKNV